MDMPKPDRGRDQAGLNSPTSAGESDRTIRRSEASTLVPDCPPQYAGIPLLKSHQIGDFELVRVMGRGGMGVVYEAVQTSLGRRVALKVLGSGLVLPANAVDRFRREAASAAKLHHTNIVPVYATGEQDGIHFYVMELIDGPALDSVIRQMRVRAGENAGPAPAPDLAAPVAYP